MITLYNATSADGYIARLDGDEDFIPDELWTEFLALCVKYDTLVMGRGTYEALQKYPEPTLKELEDLKIKKVLVTRDEKFLVKTGYEVIHSLEEVFLQGKNILISSGPTFNDSVLNQGLVDIVIKNILPEKIGEGIRQFNVEPKLTVVSERELGNGRKWVEYKVEK